MFIQGVSRNLIYTPMRTLVGDFSPPRRRTYFYGLLEYYRGIADALGCASGFFILNFFVNFPGLNSPWTMFAGLPFFAVFAFVGAIVLPTAVRRLYASEDTLESTATLLPDHVDLSEHLAAIPSLKFAAVLLVGAFGIEALVGM